MHEKLFSLKIPGGWAIIRNSFGDVEPDVKNGVIVNDEFYGEDLLSIEPLRLSEAGWLVDTSGYALDLGWYPEANPQGHYRLTLMKGGWDDVVIQCESPDRHQIHRLIEQCFTLIAQGVADAVLAEQVRLSGLMTRADFQANVQADLDSGRIITRL